MAYDVVLDMRPACFRSKGTLRCYVYEWMLNDVTVYVGRGVGKRYEMFYISRKYGTPERHKFVLDNKDALSCRFAVADVALDAAKEAEALEGSFPDSKLFRAGEPLPRSVRPSFCAGPALGRSRDKPTRGGP